MMSRIKGLVWFLWDVKISVLLEHCRNIGSINLTVYVRRIGRRWLLSYSRAVCLSIWHRLHQNSVLYFLLLLWLEDIVMKIQLHFKFGFFYLWNLKYEWWILPHTIKYSICGRPWRSSSEVETQNSGSSGNGRAQSDRPERNSKV